MTGRAPHMRFSLFACTVLMLVCTAFAAPADRTAREAAAAERIRLLRSDLRTAEREQEPSRILDILEQLRSAQGLHSADAMTAAAALAQLGRAEEAEQTILAAIDRGFVDIARLRSDPALAPLRLQGRMHNLLDHARRRLDDDAKRIRAALIEEFKDDYRYAYDAQRHIVYAAALDERSFGEMRTMIEQQFDHLATHLFGGPPPYVFRVIIPDRTDADRLLGVGDPMPGGRYEHATRTVLARNTGSSLRHEFVHALHYGDMERSGLRTAHPLWVQEGLATLFEHVEWPRGEAPRFLSNGRTRITNNLARHSRLMPWSELLTMDAQRFMTTPTRTYPEVRSLFEFFAARKALHTWYAALRDTFADDPAARDAFERAFGQPPDDVERAYRLWARQRADHAQKDMPLETWLGGEWDEFGSNDGVRIGRIVPAGPLARARLRPGDIIVALESVRIIEPQDIDRALIGRTIGAHVALHIRRDGAYLIVTAPLAAPPRGLRSLR